MPILPKSLSIFILLFASISAHAADMCFLYEEFCPGYFREALPGGSYPAFSDTFNLNPAAIPTTTTPFGVEAVYSSGGGATKGNFAIIKGLPQFGLGIANVNDDSFYSYNLLQGLKGTSGLTDQIYGYSPADSAMASMNFGTAVSPFPKTILDILPLPVLGVNLRFNQLTRRWDWQYGASINTKYITVGLSHRKSEGSQSNNSIYAGYLTQGIPTIINRTFTVGLNLPHFSADYTLLKIETEASGLKILKMFNNPVRIITGRIQFGWFSAVVAQRETYNASDYKVTTTLIGAQYLLAQTVSIGLHHNYVPGGTSASLQVLF